MSCVTVEEKVLYYDTDCGGVVSNIAYLRYVEKARCALFDKLGMSLKECTETQLFPAVVRTEIDYLKPARLGDHLFIEAKVARFEKARVFCEFSISKKDEIEDIFFLAKSLQIISLIQMPSGRPRRIPPHWLEIETAE